MARGTFARSLPGHLATALAVTAVTFLTFLSASSMYYEGWGQPLPVLLAFFLPVMALLVLCLVALRWPTSGGVLLLGAGIIFGARWLNGQAGKDVATFQVMLTLVVMFGPIIVVACLFLLEARHRRMMREQDVQPSSRWLGRNYRYLLIAGLPLLALATASATRLPPLLSRLDDGLRGARVVEGNGVVLVWAPRGPGWNWRQPDGTYLSWDMIASYGGPPVGLKGVSVYNPRGASPAEMGLTSLCAYLDEIGTTLRAEPTYVWRMPTADEIVRSLTRDGVNAGCAWTGPSPNAECRRPPDKETPLWAPDEPPIYYWAADEHDSGSASCVNYTGGLNRQPKGWTGTTLGFRCVKDVEPLRLPVR